MIKVNGISGWSPIQRDASVVLLFLLSAFLIGGVGAVNPIAPIAFLVILGVIAASIFLLQQPQKALMFSFLLIFLSETKFRTRDVHALLTGSVDAQIIFELALYGFVFLITLLNVRSWPHKYLKLTPLELVLFGYASFSLFSVLWSYTPRITLVRATQLFILCTFSFVSVRVLGPQRVLRMLAVTLVFFISLFSLIALLFPWANGTQVDYLGAARFAWFGTHPVSVAAHTAEALILIIAEALFAPGSWRRRMMGIPLWLYIVPLGLVLIAARSRGPLIAFIVTIVALLWIRGRVNPWVTGFTGYIVLTLFIVLLSLGFRFTEMLENLLSSGNPLATFLLRGQTAEQFSGLTGRTALWYNIYIAFSDRPLFGYGYGASRSFLLEILPWAAHAHNAFIQSLLNGGIVGTALVWFAFGKTLLSSFLQTVRACGPLAWHQACIFGLLLFLLVHSISDDTLAALPSYDPLLFFASIFACERLRLLVRPPKQYADATIQSPDRPQQRLYYQAG